MQMEKLGTAPTDSQAQERVALLRMQRETNP
jgi:hypothetical protein